LRRQKYEEEMFDVTVDPAISKLYDMLCQEANHNEAASIIN
jgi:hypothetical protein